jgi:Topoisomerase DNA binding C4 zinc finger
MDWRRKHEARFRYDPTPNAQDIADEKALRDRFASEKAKLEGIIRNGLGTLRNAKARLDALPAKARSDQSLLQALEERARAEQDLKLLGAPVPNSTVTLSVPPPPQPIPQPPRAPTVTTPPPRAATTTAGVPSCPRCGSLMRRRSGRYGQFWGCSRYPRCSGTRNI